MTDYIQSANYLLSVASHAVEERTVLTFARHENLFNTLIRQMIDIIIKNFNTDGLMEFQVE